MAECNLRERDGLALASVLAWRGRVREASAAARRALGASLPFEPRASYGADIAFVWSGPGHWLAVTDAARAEAAGGMEALLEPVFTGAASVVEQSDSRVIYELRGIQARAVLAKGLPLDLHPACFGPGDVALSGAAHVSLQLWQVDAAPTYLIAVPRSYAGSFRRWLEESGAEFG